MTGFANQVDDGPVILSTLEMINGQFGQLAAPQSATQQHSKYGPVPLALQCGRIRELPERSSFFCR